MYRDYTVDLMRCRMGAAERRQHDAAWGFDFGEVGVIDLVPPQYLDEPAKKKGMFAKMFGAKRPPQDSAKVAAADYPMSQNMRASFEKALSENPEMLHQADDDHGFTFLHQLALAGSWDGVDVCLKHGVDPNLAANNGMKPYDLAKSLGWKRVMGRLEEAGGS